MALQVTVGSAGLVGVGIGAGDVATLYTLSRRIGNWITAEKGDKELLTQLEEDEMAALRRRGLIDITRFQKRWDRRLRLLENGKPQRITGRPVEELLRSESHWTVMMICIVAALDEFASSSMVRNICKALLHRLFPGQDGIDMMGDVINSQLANRIEAWRSAATVREMHVTCRNKRDELMKQGLVVQGSMPEAETAEVVGFLHWLIAQETELFRTCSSDIAGIGCCLSLLSFESLTVEGFGCSSGRETNCRLIYNKAPLYNGYGVTRQDGRQRLNRELSTVVSLTQPEETFSTFPITHEVAQKCRGAWEQGTKAGKVHVLEPNHSASWESSSGSLTMCFTNKGTSVSELRGRKDPKVWSLLSLLAIFSNREICDILTEVVGRESHDTIAKVVQFISTPDSNDSAGLDDPGVCDTFTVCQAFFMGYYYSILSSVVDTSTLEVQTVSGRWGYRSPDFLRTMAQFLRHANPSSQQPNRNSLEVGRSHLLYLVATLYANMEITIPKNTSNTSLSYQKTCVGAIGKRIVLTNSLLNNCNTIEDILRFVILDCDAGGIPHTPAGLVLTGIPPRQETWEDESPPVATELSFSGPHEDCTRHIEADWDTVPEHVLLCIRYKGRRLGSLNPAHADIAFFRAHAAARQVQHRRFFAGEIPVDSPTPIVTATMKVATATTEGFVGAHESTVETLTSSGRLVTPGRHDPSIPVAVHTSLNPCFRYAATAWYSEIGDVVFVNDGNFKQAYESWRAWKNSGGLARKFVALIGTSVSE